MKTLMVTIAAASALTAGAVSAQGYGYDNGYGAGRNQWMPIEERFERLDRRIDQGIRNGQLTRNEAYRLRSEFQMIANLEGRYSRNGLTRWERADLDRRFDVLASRVRYERRDGDRYGYNGNRPYR